MIGEELEFQWFPFSELLENIVDNRGKTCPTVENGMPLIATNCIRNTNLYPVYEKIRYVSKVTYDTWFRDHPKPGDIIFVNKGTPGRVCMVPDPVNFCIAQDMVAIRANKKKVYPAYLFAVLRSKEIQNSIENMHVGTLIPHFKKTDFDRLMIPIPSEGWQRIIGDMYITFSKKIDLNQKMNKTLEAIARAIFKSWFIDFDPVHKRAEVHQLVGMDAETAALFPDSFEDSELGQIPKGWKVKSIGEAVRCVGGSTPSTKISEYWKDGTNPFVTPKDMSTLTSPVIMDTTRHITESGVNTISSGQLPIGTVLLSSRAPIGYLSIAATHVSVNQGIIAMICDKELPSYYVLYWTEANMETIKSNAGGTTFAEISKRNFRPIKLVIPPSQLLKKYNKQCELLFRRIAANLQETKNLASIRDALLPKLFSGEIQIKDAEKFVGMSHE